MEFFTFAKLTEWVAKFGISFVYKIIIRKLAGDPLFAELVKSADSWQSGLPENAHLPDVTALLGMNSRGPHDTGLQRQRRVLEQLIANKVPSVEDWEEDIFFRWKWVKEQPGERAAFFALEPDAARRHINALAIRLHQVCTLSAPHFQSSGHAMAVDTNQLVREIKNKLDTQQVPALNLQASPDSSQRPTASYSGIPDIGNEIRLAVQALEDDLPDVAITRLAILREQHWASLLPRDRYRLVANTGFAHLAKEELPIAADYLIDARRYDQDSEEARANEIMGYGLRGDMENASRLTSELVKLFPRSDLANASYVRYAPSSLSFHEIEAAVPSELRNGLETSYALAYRALGSGLPEVAEEYARSGLTHKPSAAALNEVLGYALSEQVRLFVLSTLSEDIPEKYRPRLEEALTRLTSVLKELPTIQKQKIAAVRYHIGFVHTLLGNRTDSEANFRLAYETKPDDSDYVRQYAACLLERKDEQGAISVLRKSANCDSTGRNSFLLVDTLLTLDPVSNRQEAINILDPLVAALSSVAESFRIDIVTRRLSLTATESTEESVSDVLNRIPEGSLPLFAEHFVNAYAYRISGESDSAVSSLREVLKVLPSDLPYFQMRRIAIECSRAGLARESLAIWKQIINPYTDRVDAEAVVKLASNSEDFELVLRVCSQLRKEGKYLPDPIHIEINVLQEFHCYPTALATMEELLSAPIPDTLRREILARRLHLSLQMGLFDGRDISINDLPLPNSVVAPLGFAVVQILLHTADRLECVKYAYELVRHNFSSHFAHKAVIVSFLAEEGERLVLAECEAAAVGDAVCFVENGNTERRWCIIEDGERPDRARWEYGPSEPLARKVLGKRVGDCFELSSGEIGSRSAQIVEIVPKFVCRLRATMDNWERDFPEHPFVWMFQLSKGVEDSTLADELRRINEQHEKSLAECDELYRSNNLSAFQLSSMLGCSAFEAILYCASKDDLPIRCCDEPPHEHRGTMTSQSGRAELVLDITSLASLYITGEIELLVKVPVRKYVSYGTIAELLEIQRSCRRKGDMLFVVRPEDNQLWRGFDGELVSGSPIISFPAFVEKVMKECIPFEGFPLIELEADARSFLTGELSASAAESIAFGASRGLAVWTDDFFTARVSKWSEGPGSVSSAAIAHWCVNEGLSTEEWRDSFLLRLLRFGYEPVRCTRSMVVFAGNACGWSPSGMPLLLCIDNLARSSMNGPAVVAAALTIMCTVFESAPSEFQRLTLIPLVWETIGKRHDRGWVWKQLGYEIGKVNRVDVTIRSGVLSILKMLQVARKA